MEVLNYMKRILGEQRNSDTSSEDIHALTTSHYHLSLEQTISNLIAILNSPVTRVVTSGLDFLTLLFQHTNPECLANHSQAILQLISQYVNAVYMTSDNTHSRVAFPFLLSLCSFPSPQIYLSVIPLFARRILNQSSSLYFITNLTQCIRTITISHAEEISRKTEVLRSLLEIMHTLILIESSAIWKVVKECLSALFVYPESIVVVQGFPSRKRSVFIEFSKKEKLGAEHAIRSIPHSRGKFPISSRLQKSTLEHDNPPSHFSSSLHSHITENSLLDRSTDLTTEELSEPVAFSEIGEESTGEKQSSLPAQSANMTNPMNLMNSTAPSNSLLQSTLVDTVPISAKPPLSQPPIPISIPPSTPSPTSTPTIAHSIPHVTNTTVVSSFTRMSTPLKSNRFQSTSTPVTTRSPTPSAASTPRNVRMTSLAGNTIVDMASLPISLRSYSTIESFVNSPVTSSTTIETVFNTICTSMREMNACSIVSENHS